MQIYPCCQSCTSVVDIHSTTQLFKKTCPINCMAAAAAAASDAANDAETNPQNILRRYLRRVLSDLVQGSSLIMCS